MRFKYHHWLARISGTESTLRKRGASRIQLSTLSAEVQLLESRVMLSVTWSGAGDGSSWNQSQNWIGGAVPMAQDDVTINVSSDTKIVIAGLPAVAKSLTCSGVLEIDGTITSPGIISASGGIILSGTIEHATIAQNTAIDVQGAGSLDGVTVHGDLDLTTSGANLAITNGLILNGTATLGQSARLYFNGGSQTLDGMGTVVFLDFQFNAIIANAPGMTLTIGSGITIRGGSSLQLGGTIGFNPFWGGGSNTSLVNLGTIRTDSAGTDIRLTPNGTGTLTNTGLVDVQAGNVVLNGSFTRAMLGTLNRGGGAVFLQGTLDNTGNTLALSGSTETWTLRGGTIRNGSISLSNGAQLALTNSGGTLDGVTVNGDLNLTTTDTSVSISNGLTLNGKATLGESARLYFNGSQTLGGSGTVEFTDHNYSALIANTTGMTLTIGSEITIRGGSRFPLAATIGFNPFWGGGANTSIVNLGTIETTTSGAAIRLYPQGTGTLLNQGVIHVASGDLVLGSTFTRTMLGTVNRGQGVIYLEGTLNNADRNLTLVGPADSWVLRGGSIVGGTVTTLNGATFGLTASGGILDGVTFIGDLDLTVDNTLVTILNGLTFHGTATLGLGARFYFNGGSQILGGTGTIQFLPRPFNALIANATGMTLTIGAGITVRGGSQSITGGTIGLNPFFGGGNNTSVENQGTILADSADRQIRVSPHGTGTLINSGKLIAQDGGILDWDATLPIANPNDVSITATSTLRVGGNLNVTASGATPVNLAGSLIFDGTGTAGMPQTLELVKRNQGISPVAFNGDQTIASLELSNNTYLKLIDLIDNVTGNEPEVLYANLIRVPAGTVLDLNGLVVFARSVLTDGSVINGTIIQIPDSGPLLTGVPTPAEIDVAGELDEWSIFGTGGRQFTVSVNPGLSGRSPAASPPLNFVHVELLDINSVSLAVASTIIPGETVTLLGITLPESGFYRIRVRAPSGNSTSTGNYTITAWDTTPEIRPLVLNQSETSALETPYSLDQWTFNASSGQQIQFDLINASVPGIVFTLVGPDQQSVFSGLSADSALMNLPQDGTFMLSVNSPVGATGSYSFRIIQTTVTDLQLNVSHTATLIGDAQPQLYRFEVLSPQVLSILLTDLATQGRTELYVRRGVAPTRDAYDLAATGPGRSQSLSIPSAVPGTWYVLVYGDSIPAPGDYSLLIDAKNVKITDFYPDHIGNSVPATVTISGAGFQSDTTLELIGPGGATYAPTNYSIDSFTQITATFPAGLPAGEYAIRVQSHSQSDTRMAALTITQGGVANLEARLILPDGLGRHVVSTLYVEYENTGDVPMPAPLILVQSADPDGSDRPILTLDQSRIIENFWATGLPPGTSNTAFILASGQQPGVLNPGERIQVPVYYLGLLQPYDLADNRIELEIRYWTVSDTTPIDWQNQQQSLRPASLTAEQWNAVYGNLTGGLATTGDYVQMLNQNAHYLGQLGERVTNVDELWNFEVIQALGLSAVSTLDAVVDAATPSTGVSLAFSRSYRNSVVSHYATGPLGRGWSNPWQMKLSQLDGNALIQIVSSDGAVHLFQQDTRDGHYFAGKGDSSKLINVGSGLFELHGVAGEVLRFRATGELESISDTNNNRVTATYDASRLVKLTHTNGTSISINYLNETLIGSIVDSDGRATTYGYDPTNTYLTTVTESEGFVTRYTYQTSGTPQQLHALLSIERNGVTEFFTYDSRGRLNASYLTGNAQRIDFGYDAAGMITIDADPATVGLIELYYNEHGQVMKAVDPLGNISTNEYDMNLRLAKAISPTGESRSFTWCNCGSMTSVTDELGQTTSFGFEYIAGSDFKRMTSYTDAKGNETRYSYDVHGNLLQTIYADGSVEQNANYLSNGQAQTYINRRGQATSSTYDAVGRLATETFSDGTLVSYVYNARGNLEQIVDGDDFTVYSYNDASDADRLTRVVYPTGQSLNYGYDSFGRRVQTTDQDGYQTVYSYDATGLLSNVKDGSGTIIVTYHYDSAGRLLKIEKANGTFTTYAYDAASQLTSLKNWQNETTLSSKFDYTYDSRGRRVSLTTLDGHWDYTYDGVGQLTRAVFATSQPAVLANQDLQYVYDAVGNRVRTVLNGITTNYITNSLNQYTSIGGVTRQFDADGNLIFDGVHTFDYDQENRLLRFTGPDGVTEYDYDALGNRTSVSVNGVVTHFLNGAGGVSNVLAEYDSDGQVVARNEYGVGLISRVASGNRYFYDYDAVGNTADVTSNLGITVNRYAYLPFGQPILSIETVQNPFQMTGQFGVMDVVAGDLIFMRARVYDASSGTFLSTDPLRISGGDVSLYAYGHNNPVTYLDPTGLKPNRDCFKEDHGFNVPNEVLHGPTRDFSDVGSSGCFQSAPYNLVVSESFVAIGSAAGILTNLFLVNPAFAIPTVAAGLLGGLVGGYLSGFVTDYITSLVCPPPRHTVSLSSLLDGKLAGIVNEDADTAFDPNEKRAGAGFGPQGYVDGASPVPYQIDFENEATATAPAQVVTISDFLSAEFDWSTFFWTDFGFGDTLVVVPAERQTYRTTVAMIYNGKAFQVLVDLGIRTATGEIYARFQSIDPNTELPPDVLTGFLPPEDGTGRGQGHVSYRIQPKPGLSSGSQIRNIATIVFDQQLGIRTDQVDPHDPSQGLDLGKQALITIDAGTPTSVLAVLPSISEPTIQLTWSGTDELNGSGIAAYDVYVSDNGGAFRILVQQSTASAVQFTGLKGHHYAFYSVAYDNVGHVEAAPLLADASTTIVANAAPSLEDQSFQIAENSPANAVIGTVAAEDPDAGDFLTFSITGGNGSGIVSIDAETGIITVVNSSALNFETLPVFQLIVHVADQDGLTAEKTFDVHLTNVNEVPTVTGPSVQIIEEDTAMGPLAFSVGDPESSAGNLTVTVTSSNSALISNANLAVQGTGANRTLTVTPTTNSSGTTTITISVSDGALTTTHQFQVTVNAVDDPAEIVLNPAPLSYRISNRKAQSVDNSATIIDPDTPNVNLGGTVLRVSGQRSKDQLSILKGSAIARKGKSILSNGTVIGSITSSKKGAPFTMNLNSSATQSTVQELLRAIGFKATGKNVGTRTIQLEIRPSSGVNPITASRQIFVQQ